MTLENDASFVDSEKKKKKSKKRKHDKQDNEHFSDAVNMGKDDEKVKKKQKKTKIHQDGGVCKEALDTTPNPDHREEKKNRKLKALEDKSLPSSDHVDMTLEGSDTRELKIHKSRKEKKKDECNIEIEDGKNKTEKMKKDKKKKQSKEKANGGHKGEKEANDQDGDLSKESEKKNRKLEKKMMEKDLSATENVNDATKQVENQSRKKKAIEEVKKKKKRSKKVTFSSEVEVFPLDNDDLPEKNHEKKLIQGKRFTPEEDEKIKEAVNNYIIAHSLGEKGLDMIMHSMKYPEIKNCWKEIGLALPHRPCKAVYHRAHILFERGDNTGKWNEDDFDMLRKLHAEYGPKWKLLAEITGRHRSHINDAWRRIKLANKKSGRWSQDEYQKLFDLVNTDLKLKVFAEKKSKHGMLRDNIGWTVISDTLSTRINPDCCNKWYDQLSSPMVREGIWADTDDYRLLGMLFNLDACSVEEVDWDNIIEQRPGDVCRRRWNQMIRHIHNYKTKSFPELVEILAQRYKLDVLEAREIWDNKPYVP
ncbi:cyclin-D-binding Myb-like transcription factor 1 [Impatiens glandulifera]|uniref:cyclin-D-binding Myb-like transcription factor 1 n=1 Tax=Impatiens glandulifera TaxID=253017 RepID=UPI001FB15F85|nr:cyclin-D-binding Myb-like transcription factor 1 [Impatiens glandulifera]